MANLKPEQVFTSEIQKHFGDENVVIVKVAQKGGPIRRWYKNWKVTGDQNPTEIGDIFKQLIEAAEKALNGCPIKSVTNGNTRLIRWPGFRGPRVLFV